MKSWICWLRGSSRGSSDGVPWIFFPYRRPLPYCKERQHVLQISNSLLLAIELLGTWEHRLWYERISIFPSAYFPISIIFFISFYLRCVVNLSLPLLFYFASCTLIHPLVRVTLNVTAVYLCKRTMQNKTRLELADYEAENLARLQKMFSRKWEFIFMQAEAQSKVDKKRDKLERKVLDSQERAFWDVHRPMVKRASPTRNWVNYATVSCNTRVVYLRNSRDTLSNCISARMCEHHGARH